MKMIYRIPILLTVIVAAGLAGLDVATQRQALLFNYPSEFGPALRLGSWHVYAPWAFVGWLRTWARLYPAVFFENCLIALVVFALPTMIAILVVRTTVGKSAVQSFGQDAWAKPADLVKAELMWDGSSGGRVLGKFQGKMLIFTGVEHVIVIGATRSGKGAGHVVPTLISWHGSALVYDRKGELFHITADYRKGYTYVVRFEPTNPDTVRWNPLFEVRKGRMEIADIQNVVGILVDPLGLKAGDLSFWDQAATDFFTALILHVLYAEPDENKNLTHVRIMVINLDSTLWAMQNTLHRPVLDPGSPDGLAHDEDGKVIGEVHPEVLLGATAMVDMEAKVKANVLATCRASLALFADPNVAYATSWSDFMIGDLVCSDKPMTLYVTTPQAHADRLAFLVRLFTRQTINSLMEDQHVDSRGREKKHRLLMMLDEFPKLGALPFLENAMGEMAGYGITAHLICQSFNDVFSKYGDRTALFDNMHITSVCATSEPASMKKIIERAGKSLELRESFSNPRTLFSKSHRSVSLGEQQRYILSEEDVRQLPRNKQILFVNNCKPIMADKIQYWKEGLFKDHCGKYFQRKLAKYKQLPGKADLPPQRSKVDWLAVRAVQNAPPMPPKEEKGSGGGNAKEARGAKAQVATPVETSVAPDPEAIKALEGLASLRPTDIDDVRNADDD
ncbi:MAG: type IV secretory system conjugative DNA transfer family protein [Caulobacteraceae bacterium]